MKLLRSLLPVVALLAAPALGLGPRLAADEEFEAKVMYKKAVKSTVFIVCLMKDGRAASGSGALIDAEKRIVLTNYHVVDEEPYVYVQFPIFVKDTMVTDKKEYLMKALGKVKTAPKAKVLCRDKSRDLALVQVPSVPSGTGALPLARASSEQGQDVWNIGSPGAVNQVFSVTHGTVRAVAKESFVVGDDEGNAFRVTCKVVTATNPINPGDSGGPLVNKKGELVAVSESGNFAASLVNHFIDVTEVRALLNEQKIKIKELAPETDDKSDSADSAKTPKKDPGGAEAGGPKKDVGGTEAGAPKKEPKGPSAEDEKAADLVLRRARLFENDEVNKDRYISLLKEVLKKYPGTAAAKEADKRLKATN
jgi:Trypsin-like peptidase domain